MSKIREYQGDGVVVRFDGARCIHAARCVDGLRPVFQPGRRPWIDATQAGADEIADVVRQCPSGALTYERLDGVPQEAPPETTTVRVHPDGPLFVTGRIQLVDAPPGYLAMLDGPFLAAGLFWLGLALLT